MALRGPGITLSICLSAEPALTSPQVPPPPPPPLVPLEATENMLELPHPLLQQTEDQFLSPTLPCSSPLISFSPPLDQDDYLWGLDGGEGLGGCERGAPFSSWGAKGSRTSRFCTQTVCNEPRLGLRW